MAAGWWCMTGNRQSAVASALALVLLLGVGRYYATSTSEKPPIEGDDPIYPAVYRVFDMLAARNATAFLDCGSVLGALRHNGTQFESARCPIPHSHSHSYAQTADPHSNKPHKNQPTPPISTLLLGCELLPHGPPHRHLYHCRTHPARIHHPAEPPDPATLLVPTLIDGPIDHCYVFSRVGT